MHGDIRDGGRLQRAHALSLALALALGCACGDKGTGESAGGGVAGSVVAIEGQVTATRAAAGSPARALAEGDSVFADDTVSTADGATITIELAHNGARWSLTGGVSRRVDRSTAWRAAKGSGGGLLGTAESDRTAAAGRHAERGATDRASDMEEPEAAATDQEPTAAETAAAPPDDGVPAGPPPAEPPAEAPPPPPPPPPKAAMPAPAPESKPTPEPERALRASKKRKPSRPKIEKGKPNDDPLAGLLDDDQPERRKLSRAEVLEGIAKIRGAVATCSERHDGKGKTITVMFVVTPKGTVSRADARGDAADTPLGRCLEGAVKKARFPAGRETTPVTFPFKL